MKLFHDLTSCVRARKRRRMGISILTILFTAIASLCNAQTTVSFTYDEAGNRTHRYIPMSGQSYAFITDSSLNELVIVENLDKEKKLLIYPNPTRGELKIELQGYDDLQTGAFIYLYNMTGALLISKNLSGTSDILDISEYKNATYILKIVIGDIVSEWKIVKE